MTNADAYKALGSALVVIQTERRAVNKALDDIARPMIDMKRTFDNWRNDVLTCYDAAEKRLDAALRAFKRAEEARVKAQEEEQRRQRAAEAQRQAEAAAEARRKQLAEEANAAAAAAQKRLDEAKAQLAAAAPVEAGHTAPTSISLFGPPKNSLATITEATQEIARAEDDIQAAKELAATPVAVGPVYVPPVVVAKPDLKVTGLRSRPPLWRWRIPVRFFRHPELAVNTPIRRNALSNPNEIPDEYWVLDEKAVQAHVKSMDGVSSIPQVESYDFNNR